MIITFDSAVHFFVSYNQCSGIISSFTYIYIYMYLSASRCKCNQIRLLLGINKENQFTSAIALLVG